MPDTKKVSLQILELRYETKNEPITQFTEVISQHVFPLNLVTSGLVPQSVIPLVTPPKDGTRDQSEDVATKVNSVTLGITRSPGSTINLTGDRASNTADGEDESTSCSALVRTRDV